MAPGTGIEIRTAVAADAPAIAAVLFESFVEYRSSYTDRGFNATTPTSDLLLIRMKEGPMWVALHNDAIVGTVSAIKRGEALYIRGMAVVPAARGHKIGELLMTQIENYAEAHKCKSLLLSTTPFLARAIRLYELFGYRRTSKGYAYSLWGVPRKPSVEP